MLYLTPAAVAYTLTLYMWGTCKLTEGIRTYILYIPP